MKLVKPTTKYKVDWEEALGEQEMWEVAGFRIFKRGITNITNYIKYSRELSQGKQLYCKYPATTYWLIDNDTFIGHINIRHGLNWDSRRGHGNIGYAIRKKYSGRGYGKAILKLALPKAKEIGLEKLLISCYDNNIASMKIIEANGGVRDPDHKPSKERVVYYWLNLS